MMNNLVEDEVEAGRLLSDSETHTGLSVGKQKKNGRASVTITFESLRLCGASSWMITIPTNRFHMMVYGDGRDLLPSPA